MTLIKSHSSTVLIGNGRNLPIDYWILRILWPTLNQMKGMWKLKIQIKVMKKYIN